MWNIEFVDMVNKMDPIFEADPLHSELSILDLIFYIFCNNEIKGI